MITLRDVQNSPTTEEASMADKDINRDRKDFELAIREVVDGYRKDGVNYNQEALAMALETQAELIRRDDTWGYNSEASREERKRLGIQEPRPTEAEMKHALTAEQARQGGENLGLETDVKAPQSHEDMEPLPNYNQDRIVADPQTPWNPGADDQGEGTADAKSSAKARKEATADTKEEAKEKSKQQR
jgi:hypothetical protein